jgi:hypothetical protein
MTDDVLVEHIRTTRQELFGLRFPPRHRRAGETRAGLAAPSAISPAPSRSRTSAVSTSNES